MKKIYNKTGSKVISLGAGDSPYPDTSLKVTPPGHCSHDIREFRKVNFTGLGFIVLPCKMIMCKKFANIAITVFVGTVVLYASERDSLARN